MKNEDAKVHLKRYIECVNKLIYGKENAQSLFVNEDLKGSKPLAISEIYKIFLQSFLLTKPLYIAIQIYKAIIREDKNKLLEIVSTQKLEELEIAKKLMEILYPNFRIDLKVFLEGQKNDSEKQKLEEFLNWHFNQKCEKKAINEKVAFCLSFN